MDVIRYSSENKTMAMQNDGVAGSGKLIAPHILERFRAMVKQREKLMVSEDDENGMSADEIVRLYEIVLAELTLNSKPIITDLTIIAGEHKAHGEGIAGAICARILEVPVELKLPALYLLDSIVKNIGRVYVKYFSPYLHEVFSEAYSRAHPNMHPAMRHLFHTWSTVFPSSVLQKIESRLFTQLVNHHSSDLPQLGAAESPQPTHSIQVNPKYLEASRQFGRSTADAVKAARMNTNVDAAPASVDTLKLPPSLAGRIRKSPSSVGNVRSSSPSLAAFAMNSSPKTVAGRASPSNYGFDHRVSGTKQQIKHSAASRYTNEVDLQRPRDLIKSYGMDKRADMLNNKHPQVERMDVNGADRIRVSKTWKNTEEEEFDWKDVAPTLADHGRLKNEFSSSLTSSGCLRNAAPLGPGLHHDLSNQAQLSMSSDGVNNSGIHNDYAQESLKLVQNLDGSFIHVNDTRGGKDFQMPFSVSEMLPSAANQTPPSIGSFPHVAAQDQGSAKTKFATSLTSAAGDWPPASSHVRPSLPTSQPNRPMSGQCDPWIGTQLVTNEDMKRSTFFQQFPGSQLSSKHSGMVPLNQHSFGQRNVLSKQPFLPQDLQQNVFPPPPFSVPPILAPQLKCGYDPARVSSRITTIPNSAPMVRPSMPILNVPYASTRVPGVPLPHLPQVLPVPTQMLPVSQNRTRVAPKPVGVGDYSSLFNCLMTQGLISLTNQAPAQDSVGLEFDADLLKVRHESAITAMYADLPRQCTTCGLRFKCQEAHSSHMDWHVTKNRMSKNRKQKPSRKWFVNVNMWLTGTEERDAVPGFLQSENILEGKDHEELAVPADDDQKLCALCQEAFDYFYSDETEEWMYKGAVYMNAPSGLTVGLDISQLGPIVHAKCRPETTALSSEDFRKNEDYEEEGSERKRMRI